MINSSQPNLLLSSLRACQLCRNAPGASYIGTSFSLLEQMANNGCAFCSVIREAIVRLTESNRFTTVQILHAHRLSGKKLLQACARTSSGDEATIELYTDKAHPVAMFPRCPSAPHISADSSSPECFAKARGWIDYCLEKHAPLNCPENSKTLLPTRVVDVGTPMSDPKLYEAAPGEQGVWAALSYCWGAHTTLKTTTETLSYMKAGFKLETLPRTIRDAVVAARFLKIPYLWVDSLCIIQDSSEDWGKEASRMCYTYENALVTFAALNSPTSDSGLFLSERRRTIQLTTQISGKPGVIYARFASQNIVRGVVHRRENTLQGSPRGADVLDTRGWTLQELVLSPRILWFTAYELGWSCWSSTACECYEGEPFVKHVDGVKISSSFQQRQTGASDLMCTWLKIVEDFTRRSLTVPTDRLAAISGLAAALQARHRTKYLAGLWASDLQTQLLWYRNQQESRPLFDASVPSWSWASIEGPVRFFTPLRYEWKSLWSIVSYQLEPTASDYFGWGKRTIIIESTLLGLHWDGSILTWDGSIMTWNDPTDVHVHDENRIFSRMHDVIWDAGHATVAPGTNLAFVLAGLQMSYSGIEQPLLLYARGLVLKAVPGENTFTRVGFSTSAQKYPLSRDQWDTWEPHFLRRRIALV